MPNMTGDRLAGELLQIRPDIPIILYTGYSDMTIIDKFSNIGVKDLLMNHLICVILAKPYVKPWRKERSSDERAQNFSCR